MLIYNGQRIIMGFFVARQPIFDRENKVYGYELLYRGGFDNYYDENMDDDDATSDVLTSSFMVIGIKELTDGKKAFINFTTNLILEQVPTIFDKHIVVVEVLERVEPDTEIVTACRELKEKGYLIALDDFVFSRKYIPLLKIADIVKVDYMESDYETRKKLVQIAKKYGLELLAEKVETKEEFEEGLEMGFAYFQGYYFSKPVILEGQGIPVYAVNYFQALKEINRDNADIKKLSAIVSRDVALSYKLLRLINSAAFGMRSKVESISNAIMLLGLNEVKKWMNLIVVKEMASESEEELIRLSLIRAKFCEEMAITLGQLNEKSDFFLMGLFSLIDVLLNSKLEKVLDQLPIDNKIKMSLLGYGSLMKDVYDIILTYEAAKWYKFAKQAKNLNLEEEIIAKIYIESIEWCNEVMDLEN